MSSAEDDQELDRLAQLHLAGAHAALEYWHQAEPFKVDHALVRKFNATYATVAHTMAQVAAAVALHQQGSVYAARVNARVALEHALVAQWVVHNEHGEDQLIGSMNRIHRNMVQDLHQAGVVIPPQMQGDLTHPSGEPQLNFMTIAHSFDDGTRSIYGLYRQMTGAVHVSLATLTTYIEWREDSAVPALRPSAAGERDSEQFLALGLSAVLALSAIERLRSGQPHLATVYKLAESHELVPDLRPAQFTP
ncbi:hypothetical protein ACIBMZ_30495 [Micromonospora sp. NPDC049900]|uniref:hypothetical protein n=1 Tax=Micromonospora sp. NPDC049900 TaxID=3364275 RepID=UPI00378DC2D1